MNNYYQIINLPKKLKNKQVTFITLKINTFQIINQEL